MFKSSNAATSDVSTSLRNTFDNMNRTLHEQNKTLNEHVFHDPSYESHMTFMDKSSVAQIGENQDLQSSGAIGFSSCAVNSPTLQDQWLNNTCYPHPTPYQFPLSSTSDIQPMPGTNNTCTFQQNMPAISPLPLDSHHAMDFRLTIQSLQSRMLPLLNLNSLKQEQPRFRITHFKRLLA